MTVFSRGRGSGWGGRGGSGIAASSRGPEVTGPGLLPPLLLTLLAPTQGVLNATHRRSLGPQFLFFRE